jgi:hypothetical protein
MNRGELIASVRAEYELLERLGGTAGVHARDRERLYSMLSPTIPARIDHFFPPVPSGESMVIDQDIEWVCAKEFVLFVFNFMNVHPKKGNHTTRRMKRRLGDKMQKTGNKLFFRSVDLGDVFECFVTVLINDTSHDEIVTGTRISADVLQGLRAQKTRVMDMFRVRLRDV